MPTPRNRRSTKVRENAGDVQFVSTRVGTARQADRARRLRASSRRYLIRIIAVLGVIVALLAGWAALYNSSAFSIESVTVKGVQHLTSEEMAELASVPADTTLLRVDTDEIAKRIKQDSWVEDVKVNRVFPNTLEIDVTERTVAAVVEISTGSGGTVDEWAIAKDHVWLMPIPKAGSEAAKTTSEQVYTDAAQAMHIVDVPHGTRAAIGEVCTDSNVNNALDIIAGMTTELADHVVQVSAAGTAETTLLLDNGVEIAFGKAEDIRDKERTILKILEENPDSISYINVRMVETPTWRGL
ncbi:MAG: FtsQ-type POTRA domain-containing protein [Atopobiaceae bacterium]|nr:FtsQ-type POTRA domain-containing protein [Atopobiaceae bacterium]